MRRVSHRHDKAEAVYESEVASHVDYEAIEGGRRNCTGRAGLLSKSDELGIRHADQKAQSSAKRHWFRRIRHFEETPQIWKRDARQSGASRHAGEGKNEPYGVQQIREPGVEDADESDTSVHGNSHYRRI